MLSQKQYPLEPACASLVALMFIEKWIFMFVWDLKLLLNLQAKTGPMKNWTRLFFQSGKPNEVSQPLYDLPLLRLFLTKETLKNFFSQSSFARFHKLAVTKNLYQRNLNLLRGFSSNLLKRHIKYTTLATFR